MKINSWTDMELLAFGGFADMALEERFLIENLELQNKVLQEIADIKQGRSNKDIFQLNSILTELRKMEAARGLNISFPRMIVDSWEYTDELGSRLLGLFYLYRKL